MRSRSESLDPSRRHATTLEGIGQGVGKEVMSEAFMGIAQGSV